MSSTRTTEAAELEAVAAALRGDERLLPAVKVAPTGPLVRPTFDETKRFSRKIDEYGAAVDRLTAEWVVERRLKPEAVINALLHLAAGVAVATGHEDFLDYAREIYAAERSARQQEPE